MGSETKGGVLDLQHGSQTHTDLWFHSLVAEGQKKCQQARAQQVTEISLSDCNRGNEADPNGCSGGPAGKSLSSCDD